MAITEYEDKEKACRTKSDRTMYRTTDVEKVFLASAFEFFEILFHSFTLFFVICLFGFGSNRIIPFYRNYIQAVFYNLYTTA